MKLLEKQKRELRDTENLLKQLTPTEVTTNSTIFSLSNGSTSMSNATSITASVFAGVDYGFVSRSEGCRFESLESQFPTSDINPKFQGYGPPANIWKLGWQQFNRNLDAIRGEYRDEENISKYQVILSFSLLHGYCIHSSLP